MPEQNQNTDPFQSFQEEADTVAKLPPSEIRRLGDRRRTTRRIGVAGGIAAACVVAVSAVALTLPGGLNSGPDVAATASPVITTPAPTEAPETTTAPVTTSVPPTDAPATDTPTTTDVNTSGPVVTQPPAAVPPTWANVPGVSLMFPQSQETGTLTGQYEGLGQAGLGLCDPGDPAQALPSGEKVTILTRTFAWVGGTGDGVGRTVRVVGLGSVEAANQVYDLYANQAATCHSRYQDDEEFHGPRVYAAGDDLPFDGSGASQPARAGYWSMILLRRASDTGRFNEVMVLQSGTRVMVLTATFDGMDHNCGVAPNDDAGQCDFPAALPELLALLDD